VIAFPQQFLRQESALRFPGSHRGGKQMALKDQLQKFLADSDSGPERKKLAERLLKDADDEESAGLINRLLDQVAEKGKSK
jgi:hypothetical protein